MFIILQIFFLQGCVLGGLFLKLFKCQRNSVSAQNIIKLFKVFSFNHFNNLLEIKAKRAKHSKTGEYHLGNII